DFYSQYLLFDGLTQFALVNGALELQPGLAVSWTAKDETTWEFKLRPNVKFHNGDPFTAEDVKFSFDRIMDPANKLVAASRVATIKEVRVVDPMTVNIIPKAA